MATAVLGTSAHTSSWGSTENEKYSSNSHWGKSNGSVWGASARDENDSWASGGGQGGWASGGGSGGWPSGTTSSWPTNDDGEAWGSKTDRWGDEERDPGTSSDSKGKQSTLSEHWSTNAEPKNATRTRRRSPLKKEIKPAPTTAPAGDSATTNISTGWGPANQVGWGSNGGTSASRWSAAPAWGTSTDAFTKDPAPINEATANAQDHNAAQNSSSFLPPNYILQADGSALYHPYPTSYDLPAMWAARYTGYFTPIDFAASRDVLAEAIDRNLERYYWDLRYEAELPMLSPYIHEMRNLPSNHQDILMDRLAHLDFMISRVQRQFHLVSTSTKNLGIFAASSGSFTSQADRDVKLTVYKALRLLHKAWKPEEYLPSTLDWEGDHRMPYRSGAMI